MKHLDDKLLSFLEARILGVLVEKERTTPDVYPLTLSSLTTGCNQKTAREPVVSVEEAEVQSALEALRSRVLVIESYGASGRVLRYAQNVARVYGLPAGSVALLATLVLRGPQTASELRANSARLHSFDDNSAVEAYLDEMAERSTGALVVRLPKQPGSREPRWTHLLCGDAEGWARNEARPPASPGEPADLIDRVVRIEKEVAELRAALQDLTKLARAAARSTDDPQPR
ncbi:YceH family protein [Accumulibacter sp.]|uniref:YceH family protein n=1 Tax=Accumulibacter sp. TaxID=2053492 RepID=UPI0025CC61F3|nr:YceH family protein [Accumulibacter sp.]MCM8593882.1 YceH family protein [Accumulibacter sp.]MCM8626076.1 YceH family protein [Accumulibacter sp.]MDS4048023.1 YceH family protein [Accumulibacter sp.]